MIANLRYFVGEALTSMNRSRGVSVLAVATIAIALGILGTFLYLSSNVNDVVVRWSREVQLSVYLKDDVEATQLESLLERLRREPRVESATYVSKEEALARFRTYFADLSDLPEKLGENPLPASVEVQLVEGRGEPAEIRGLAATFAGLEGVEDVEYDTGWVERLDSLVKLVSGVGFLLGGILLLAATATTSNVIRLALFSRQDEIEILRLVGATRRYIQGPFLVEGILQGSLGGLLALAALAALHLAVRTAGDVNLVVRLATARFLGPVPALALVVAGAAMGLVGAFFAVRKYLKT
jgi:cell division transport system permease protein